MNSSAIKFTAAALLAVAFAAGCRTTTHTTTSVPPVLPRVGAQVGLEYHVAAGGDDANDGSATGMLKTISAAALRAQPGDTITVHEGVYRELVNPPRGGESDQKRIVYRAAPGERVEIRGSEVVKSWEKVQDNTWKTTLTNTFFGGYNPYNDLIRGHWFDSKGMAHHTGAVYLDGNWLSEAARLDDVLTTSGENPRWFAKVDNDATTIWAQFKDVNPNDRLVEINVRRAVFYPEKPGMNYITVRGFSMRHAATQWAPPTAEQIGLIGTHWSRGWIIEDNDISHSACVGISLGKYGDEWDNKMADTAEVYVKTINRALTNGWAKGSVGHHIVRNNHISHCEQAGVVGSLGAVFSQITGNTIHDIHVKKQFGGAEMAGIKLHAAVDVEISGNHIYRSIMGVWLDWMAQGTRVTRNLMHDNPWQDVFVEVNHGPFLVDNNILLSPRAIWDMSRGGAYVHNLIAGGLLVHLADRRQTPFLKPHSTALGGMHGNLAGDDRFYNNIFAAGCDVSQYDRASMLSFMGGNVFVQGAKPCKYEDSPLVAAGFDPAVKLEMRQDGTYLDITLDKAWATGRKRSLVTTQVLGRTDVAGLPYEQADGSSLRVGSDYFGVPRKSGNPFPGPFELHEGGRLSLKVWPTRDRDARASQ